MVAQLLVSRGVTEPSAAREFLDPKLADLRDPQLLPGCADAAALIHQAVRAESGFAFTAITTSTA